MSSSTGKYLMIVGLIILVIGCILYFFGNKLQWLGRLPGDIRVEKENFKFYFPITTMILLSAVFNLLVIAIRKFLN